MIRFIDLRHVAEDIGGGRFAFYDTVRNIFITDEFGAQTWRTLEEFAVHYEGYEGDNIARFHRLTPEWANYSDVKQRQKESDEDKPTDSELHAEATDMRHTEGSNGGTL